MSTTAHPWEFRARFRRNAYGWKSQPAITRIKQAVSEIRKVAKKDAALGAEGAVLFLEKLAPAIEHVDSSSGSIGTAVNRAIDDLVPVIAAAVVDAETREAWLERLWQAIQDDDMPYIEHLGDRWGDLCAEPDIASRWADELLPITTRVLIDEVAKGAFFKGTSACLSALFAAGRYEELIALAGEERRRILPDYLAYGARALAATGRVDLAISRLESSRRPNDGVWRIASYCEEILLADGQGERAFLAYGFEANLKSTFLATYRALCKKYPMIEPRTILSHCIKQTPGEEGKWFAAARHAGFLDLALQLATSHFTEPQTLINAARDHAVTDPDFTIQIGITALFAIDSGLGYYEPLPVDVNTAYEAIRKAADAAGTTAGVNAALRDLFGPPKSSAFVWKHLARRIDQG